MAEYDYVDKSTGADYYGEGVTPCGIGQRGPFVWKRTVNLATAGDLFTSTGAFSAADILNLFNVSEGMFIAGVAIEVTTVEASTLAVTIGDGDNAAGFLVAGNLNSAVWQSGSTTTTYSSDYFDGTTYFTGKLYTAADTIDMTLTTASADVAVFDIYVFGWDLRPVS